MVHGNVLDYMGALYLIVPNLGEYIFNFDRYSVGLIYCF